MAMGRLGIASVTAQGSPEPLRRENEDRDFQLATAEGPDMAMQGDTSAPCETHAGNT